MSSVPGPDGFRFSQVIHQVTPLISAPGRENGETTWGGEIPTRRTRLKESAVFVSLNEEGCGFLLDVHHSRQILQIRITRNHFSLLISRRGVHNGIGHRKVVV